MRVLGVSFTTIDENLYEAVRAGSRGGAFGTAIDGTRSGGH